MRGGARLAAARGGSLGGGRQGKDRECCRTGYLPARGESKGGLEFLILEHKGTVVPTKRSQEFKDNNIWGT